MVSARASGEPLHRLAMPAVFTWLLAGVGALAAWHMFAVPWMLFTVALAVALATFLAWLLHRAPVGRQVLALGLTYLAGATVVATPQLLGDTRGFAAQALRVATAPVTGWKDLLTLDLPLGQFQTVLAPVFFLFLVAPFAALLMSWRGHPGSALAPIVALSMPLFAILFGSSAVDTRFQTAIGGLTFLIALAWFVWLATAIRRSSLARAQVAVQGKRTGRAATVSRVISALVMLVLAVLIATPATPRLLAGETRDVLRTSVHPEIEIEQFVSPLTTFRQYRSDARFNEELFNVEAPQTVSRIRIATLDHFDGTTMRTGVSPSGTSAPDFRRVPSTLPRVGGDPATVTITLGSYDGVWVPLAGNLIAISFAGPNRAALSDGFYYQRETRTGVQLADGGFEAGDVIEETVTPVETGNVSEFQRSRPGPSLDETLIPPSLGTWIADQGVPSGGQGLMALINRLRARTYLSHDIMLSSDEPAWMLEYGVSEFEPSRAGHSAARIERLFADLNRRQSEAGVGAPDEELVATVGDDEQLAVAAFLIADALGFESRVVLGAKLTGAGADDGVPPCELGVCRGANVTAWLEVRDAASGAWGIIDVTPQHDVPPLAEAVLTSEPKHATEVDSERGDTVPPPDASPNDHAAPVSDPDDVSEVWAKILAVIRVVGIALFALLIVMTPFLVIVAIKSINARARRRARNPRVRLTGGWDHVVDAAVDHGAPYPGSETRTEYATLIGDRAEGLTVLAQTADEAAFSPREISDHEAEEYWRLVDQTRHAFATRASVWRRIRAQMSPRSIRASVARELRLQEMAPPSVNQHVDN